MATKRFALQYQGIFRAELQKTSFKVISEFMDNFLTITIEADGIRYCDSRKSFL